MKRSRTIVFLILWGLVFTVIGSKQMRSHWVPLPVPTVDAEEILTVPGTPKNTWVVLHILEEGCGCSQRVVNHLKEFVPEADVHERIIWVSEQGDATLPAPQGFEVENCKPDVVAARYRVEAAPVLVIVAPDGTVRYRGGYTQKKQGYAILDRVILAAIRRGERPPVLPVYGCAMTTR